MANKEPTEDERLAMLKQMANELKAMVNDGKGSLVLPTNVPKDTAITNWQGAVVCLERSTTLPNRIYAYIDMEGGAMGGDGIKDGGNKAKAVGYYDLSKDRAIRYKDSEERLNELNNPNRKKSGAAPSV
jgi:hypothetical protein